MKIVAGLGTIEDYEDYVDAGADELFIGYVPYEWQSKHELNNPLNRREVSYVNLNVGALSDLEILSERVDKRKVPVTIAFNGLNYRPNQYELICKIINDCADMGFKDVIIADIGLLIYLDKFKINERLNIHISGEFGEMNSYQIKILKELGAKRIIYHRGCNVKDIASMIKRYPELEHEVFLMHENCHFTGAYCNSMHSDELIPMCRMPYQLEGRIEVIRTSCSECDDYLDGCRLCLIDTFRQIGVTHLKIVGRGASTDLMIDSIKRARREIG